MSCQTCKISRKRSRRRFGNYQSQVNDLTGAMGPTTTAFWPDLGPVKDPWSMAAQPLYFSGPDQRYMISPDVNADKLSVMSFGIPSRTLQILKDRKKSQPRFIARYSNEERRKILRKNGLHGIYPLLQLKHDKRSFSSRFGTKRFRDGIFREKTLSKIAFHPNVSKGLNEALSKRFKGEFEHPRTKDAHELAESIKREIKDYKNKFPEKDYIKAMFKLRYPNSFGTKEHKDFHLVKDYVHQHMYRPGITANKMHSYLHSKGAKSYTGKPLSFDNVRHLKKKLYNGKTKDEKDAIMGLYKLKGY